MRKKGQGQGSVIFLHIPKAAGSTLHRVIERQYDKGAIFHVSGTDVRGAIEAFQRLPLRSREKIACLKGHIPYGLHGYMAQPCRYITLLRNPIDRIVSHYHFVLRSPNHYLHGQVVSGDMTLEDYVKSGISSELNNGQTRQLAGGMKEDEPAELLERAKRHLLQGCVVVGLAERFDESLILMKRRLGWRHVHYRKRRVAPARPFTQDISPRTIQLIAESNEKDEELYAFAQNLLREHIQAQDRSFGVEVKRLRLLNRLYGLIPAGLR
jgi:hypothetical protein